MNEQPLALRLADALAEQAHHHRMIAHDCDMRPEDTINWAHHVGCIEASAELRRLHAEVETLRADRDSWRQQASDRVDDAVRFAAERDALRAEVKRLNAQRNDAMREMRSLRADAERYRQPAPVAQPSDEQIAKLAWKVGMGPAIVAGADVVGFARAVLALRPVAQPLTDEYVDALVRSVQPDLDANCKAWKQLSEQCRYWLEVERTHKIGGPA